MVAIQHDTTTFPAPREPALRPRLRVIEGGRSPARMAVTYRRRRLVVLLAAVAVVVLAVVGALALVAATRSLVKPAVAVATSPGPSGTAHTVVAQPGDTLWSIAERLPHHGDVRVLVDQLAALNGGSQLSAGQRIVVPAG